MALRRLGSPGKAKVAAHPGTSPTAGNGKLSAGHDVVINMRAGAALRRVAIGATNRSMRG
ncbi:hypothetical protein GCM10007860_22930 [Chitiniphilus shinanonensis]|uniref:Uncharacterized protein n=1 Tax=Chitiniphilus shinanonensis TaxID=553088 RepID=A0ABQ6BTX1_9NEIS|nr:hypothetical protein GCM10007860_22930 [Chitiniphilus shinanonensis]